MAKGSFITVAFPNAEAISNAFRELQKYAGTRTAKNAMQRSLLKVSQPCVMLAESLAPRAEEIIHRYGRDILPGSFAGKIKVSALLSKRQMRQNKMTRTGPNDAIVFIGSNPARLGVLIEFGSGPRYTKKTHAYRGMMPAHPFMRPAWDQSKTKMLDDLSKELWNQIAAATERARRKFAKGTKK